MTQTMTVTAQTPSLGTIADQLVRLAGEIEGLGEMLCADPDIMARSMRQLQAIDAIAQQQLCLAAIVRAEDRAAATADCSFAELKERLLRG